MGDCEVGFFFGGGGGGGGHTTCMRKNWTNAEVQGGCCALDKTLGMNVKLCMRPLS